MDEELTKLVFRIVGVLLGKATEEVGYMWKCSDNVKLLKEETQKLSEMKGRVEQDIVEAKDKGEQLLDGVQNWVDKADTCITDAKKLLEEERNAEKKCCDLSHLHHVGKIAITKYSSLVEHQKDGDIYKNRVSVHTPQKKFSESQARKNLDDINTQKDAVRKVIEAIKDESIQIVAIYGPGGVGKTTIAVEVGATLEDQLFDCVVFVYVTQSVDVKMIQEKVKVAAMRTKNKERVLIILDDVWKKIDLHEVGILYGGEYKCKILLTCRKHEVCESMCAQSGIDVGFLQQQEAQILFRRVIGERLETNTKLKSTAQELIKECGGSPLLIHAVADSLKDKNIGEWTATLDRLKKHDTDNISEDIKSAFISLKRSYELLGTDNEKSSFLLCSMFPKGSPIPLERLTHYLVALKMLKRVDKIKEARQCVILAVRNLKSSFLLSDGSDKSTTKMHDIVHQVAHTIASEIEAKILVQAGEDLDKWRPTEEESASYTRISLMKNDICELPDHDLPFKILNTLLIQDNRNLSKIPDRFLQSIQKTEVLDMEHNNISSLPSSLKLLTRLCYLNLGGNRSLQDIAILGELLALEILILNDTGIENVPQEIGQLVKLRLLEVKLCQNLSHIATDVISKLCRLEELHIGFYVVHEGSNKSLLELNKLEMLTFLDLFVTDSAFIPEGVHFEKIKEFVIQIGGNTPTSLSPWVLYDLQSTHNLIVRTISFPFPKEIEKLLNVSHDISLKSVAKLNSVIPMLYYGTSKKFTSIVLSECNDVTCLVDKRIPAGGKHMKDVFLSELEHLDLSQLNGIDVIWKCQDKYISLYNLTTLNIDNCPKLQKLFPVSVAKGLVNLERLSIKYCVFKSVIAAEEDTEQAFDLCRLAEISFYSLPHLVSFSSGNFGIKYPALVKVSISKCSSMRLWGNGVHETPKLKFVDDVPVNGICFINDAAKKCYESKRDGFIATATRTSINLDM